MSKENIPDAWDDDWETQVDQQGEQATSNERAAKASKAERLAKHAELNRKLWDSAESTDNFFLDAKNDVPLKTEFKPAVKVLSRKPTPKIAPGMSQLALDDEDDENEGSSKKHAPSPEELRLRAQREREEKQRRYEEARERLFGSSAPASRTASPGTLTPPKAGEGKGVRGKGKSRGIRDSKSPPENTSNSRSKKSPIDNSTDRTSDGRQLYEPEYSAKPDSSFLQKRGVLQLSDSLSTSDESQQPIRSPRGPDGSTSLHVLDVYLPRPPPREDPRGLWVIYIHGGAWRDPDVSMESFDPALNLLLEWQQKDDIVGFASINYRLSPYHRHSTNPSSSSDPARNAEHPDHIHDTLAAIYFLQQKYGFKERYLLVGHSCGATLAFQTVMGRWSQTSGNVGIALPFGILGVAGIYDLIRIRDNHCNASVYQTFLEDAFGKSEGIWTEASPTSGDYDKSWPNGKLALVVHSLEDELVEEEQATLMVQTLRRGGSGEESKRLNILHILETGKHDEIWDRGILLATVIAKAVGLLTLKS
ncbi:hypothetical protein FGG08_002880 [Glutinoglossum americanum]|uniref:Kynurenine formamidase n=1 Tax=Glutinoglossum americanum TaxID=1670608 RepID=A0A9P8I8S6_9PEZI|nr:hypothetical protein FGG08_002880 [Glutinoglossum americanum]